MSKQPKKEYQRVVVRDERLKALGDFTQVAYSVLTCATLSVGARLTFWILLSYAREEKANELQGKIAEDLGVTERGVRKWLVELRAFGFVDWKKLPRGQGNLYFIDKAPEALAVDLGFEQSDIVGDDPAMTILDGGWVGIPKEFLRDKKHTLGAKVSYALLLHYRNLSARFHRPIAPATATLAKDLGVSRRSIDTWLKQLREAGLLQWSKGSYGAPNTYIIRLPGNPFNEKDRAWRGRPEQIAQLVENRSSLGSKTGTDCTIRPEQNAQQDRNRLHTNKTTKNLKTTTGDVVVDLERKKDSLMLIGLFHQLIGDGDAFVPQPKEFERAGELLESHTLEDAEFIVRWAVSAARQTNWNIQVFGSVMKYVPKALKALEDNKHSARRRANEQDAEAAQRRQAAIEEAEWLKRPLDERVDHLVNRWMGMREALKRPPTDTELAEYREDTYINEVKREEG